MNSENELHALETEWLKAQIGKNNSYIEHVVSDKSIPLAWKNTPSFQAQLLFVLIDHVGQGSDAAVSKRGAALKAQISKWIQAVIEMEGNPLNDYRHTKRKELIEMVNVILKQCNALASSNHQVVTNSDIELLQQCISDYQDYMLDALNKEQPLELKQSDWEQKIRQNMLNNPTRPNELEPIRKLILAAGSDEKKEDDTDESYKSTNFYDDLIKKEPSLVGKTAIEIMKSFGYKLVGFVGDPDKPLHPLCSFVRQSNCTETMVADMVAAIELDEKQSAKKTTIDEDVIHTIDELSSVITEPQQFTIINNELFIVEAGQPNVNITNTVGTMNSTTSSLFDPAQSMFNPNSQVEIFNVLHLATILVLLQRVFLHGSIEARFIGRFHRLITEISKYQSSKASTTLALNIAMNSNLPSQSIQHSYNTAVMATKISEQTVMENFLSKPYSNKLWIYMLAIQVGLYTFMNQDTADMYKHSMSVMTNPISLMVSPLSNLPLSYIGATYVGTAMIKAVAKYNQANLGVKMAMLDLLQISLLLTLSYEDPLAVAASTASYVVGSHLSTAVSWCTEGRLSNGVSSFLKIVDMTLQQSLLDYRKEEEDSDDNSTNKLKIEGGTLEEYNDLFEQVIKVFEDGNIPSDVVNEFKNHYYLGIDSNDITIIKLATSPDHFDLSKYVLLSSQQFSINTENSTEINKVSNRIIISDNDIQKDIIYSETLNQRQ